MWCMPQLYVPTPPPWCALSHAATARYVPRGGLKSTARQEAWKLRRPLPAMRAPRRNVEMTDTRPNFARIWARRFFSTPGRHPVEEPPASADVEMGMANTPATIANVHNERNETLSLMIGLLPYCGFSCRYWPGLPKRSPDGQQSWRRRVSGSNVAWRVSGKLRFRRKLSKLRDFQKVVCQQTAPAEPIPLRETRILRFTEHHGT